MVLSTGRVKLPPNHLIMWEKLEMVSLKEEVVSSTIPEICTRESLL